MGNQSYIDVKKFPKQGNHLNKQVQVCFHYRTKTLVAGKIVRDDVQEPFVTIISLEDGRFVLATECQYQILD